MAALAPTRGIMASDRVILCLRRRNHIPRWLLASPLAFV